MEKLKKMMKHNYTSAEMLSSNRKINISDDQLKKLYDNLGKGLHQMPKFMYFESDVIVQIYCGTDQASCYTFIIENSKTLRILNEMDIITYHY